MGNESLGECLYRLRTSFNYTLRDVEQAVGISNAYLSQLENNKIRRPSANVLYKLAVLFKEPLENILIAAGIVSSEIKDKGVNKQFYISNLDEVEYNKLNDYLFFLRFKKSHNL